MENVLNFRRQRSFNPQESIDDLWIAAYLMTFMKFSAGSGWCRLLKAVWTKSGRNNQIQQPESTTRWQRQAPDATGADREQQVILPLAY